MSICYAARNTLQIIRRLQSGLFAGSTTFRNFIQMSIYNLVAMVEALGEKAYVRWLAVGAMAIVLTLLWSMRISDDPIEKDAAQTMQMGANLKYHGIISEDESEPFEPSMLREPVPIVAAALSMAVGDLILGEADPGAYAKGDHARLLKYQNIAWMGLLCAAIFVAVVFFTSSWPAALASVILINLPLLNFTTSRYMIDSLYTEAPAAALLAWGSFLLVMGLERGRWPHVIAAGLTFGALALVKAVFLYVFIGLLLVFIAAAPFRWNADSPLQRLSRTVVLALCFAIVVGPWIMRNHQAFGTAAITYRGGEVLHIRAVKDRMTPTEIRGAIYFWGAPWPLNGLLRRVLGFDRNAVERGGPLERLNRTENSSFADNDHAAEAAGRPEDAVSYYRQSRAQLKRFSLDLDPEAQGGPSLKADKAMQDLALKMIREEPVRHLLLTPLFLWRGAFFAFPILTLGLIVAFKQRHYSLALFIIPAFGMIMFYGLFSHFIGRYGLPAKPIVIATAFLLCIQGFLWLRHRTQATQF